MLPDSKIGAVAVLDCATDIPNHLFLHNGTHVMRGACLPVDDEWRRWLGDARIEKLQRSGVVIARYALIDDYEEVTDLDRRLSNEASCVFSLLMCFSVVTHGEAFSVRCINDNGRAALRQYAQLRPFFRLLPELTVRLAAAQLSAADELLPLWLAIGKRTDCQRFKRGFKIMLDGLKKLYCDDRIDQFVRSLEGLILPAAGSTERQFVHRCLTFVGATDENRAVLREAFRIRSDDEHVHAWNRSVGADDDENRLRIITIRALQLERLAAFAYLRVLRSEALIEHFSDDAKLAGFWALPDHIRSELWGETLDLRSAGTPA